jgi:hypothetical protein
MTDRVIINEVWTSGLGAYSTLAGSGTTAINGSNRLQLDQTGGNFDWFSFIARQPLLIRRPFSLNSNENEAVMAINIESITQSNPTAELMTGFYKDDTNVVFISVGTDFTRGGTADNNTWVLANNIVDAVYPKSVRIKYRRQAPLGTRQAPLIKIWLEYYNGSEWVDYHYNTISFEPTDVFFALKTYSGAPTASAQIASYTLTARDLYGDSTDFSDDFNDNTFDMPTLFGTGTFSEVGGRLVASRGLGETGDWWTGLARQGRLAYRYLNILETHKRVTFEIDFHSIVGSGGGYMGMFGLYFDDNNHIQILFDPTTLYAGQAVNGTFSTITSVGGITFPRRVRLVLNLAGPGTGNTSETVSLEYFDGTWINLTTQSLVAIPDRIHLGVKTFSGTPSTTVEFENLVVTYESVDGNDITVLYSDDFEDGTNTLSTLPGSGTVSEAGGNLRLETPVSTASDWFTAIPREGLLAYSSFLIDTNDRLMWLDIDVDSHFESSNDAEGLAGFHLDDQNFVAWVITDSNIVPIIVTADSWNALGLVSHSLPTPQKVRILWSNPTPGNPDLRRRVSFYYQNIRGAWVAQSLNQTLLYEPNKVFFNNKTFASNPNAILEYRSVSLKSDSLGLNLTFLYNDHFDNNVVDFDQLAGIGVVTEPVGSEMVISASIGDDISWSLGTRSVRSALRNFNLGAGDKAVYGLMYITPPFDSAEHESHFTLYQDDANYYFIQLLLQTAQVYSVIGGTQTLLFSFQSGEADGNKVMFMWDVVANTVKFSVFDAGFQEWIESGTYSMGAIVPIGALWGIYGSNNLISNVSQSFDLIQLASDADDVTPPVLQNLSPAGGAIGVARNTNIVIEIVDGPPAPTDVDDQTVDLDVGGSDAWSGDAQQAGYSVVKSRVTRGYRYDINPDADLPESEVISIDVVADDTSPAANTLTTSYSFTTAGDTPILQNQVPMNSATGVLPSTTIVLEIVDVGSGIDLSNTVVTVAGTIAYNNGNQNGFSVAVVSITDGYRLTITPPSDLASGINTVRVQTQDNASIPNTIDQTYSFEVIVVEPPPPTLSNEVAFINSRPYKKELLPAQVSTGGVNSLVLVNACCEESGFYTGYTAVYFGTAHTECREVLSYSSTHTITLDRDYDQTIQMNDYLYLIPPDFWLPERLHLGIRPSSGSKLDLSTLNFMIFNGSAGFDSYRDLTRPGNPLLEHTGRLSADSSREGAVLDLSAPGSQIVDQEYSGLVIRMLSGNNKGETRRILDYDGTTKTMSFDRLPNPTRQDDLYSLEVLPRVSFENIVGIFSNDFVAIDTSKCGLRITDDGSTPKKSAITMKGSDTNYDYLTPLQLEVLLRIISIEFNGEECGVQFGFSLFGSPRLSVRCEIRRSSGSDLVLRLYSDSSFTEFVLESAVGTTITDKMFNITLTYDPQKDTLYVTVENPRTKEVIIDGDTITPIKGNYTYNPLNSAQHSPYGFLSAGLPGAVVDVEFIAFNFFDDGEYTILNGVIQGLRDAALLPSVAAANTPGLLPGSWDRPWRSVFNDAPYESNNVSEILDLSTRSIVISKPDALSTQPLIRHRTETALEILALRGFIYEFEISIDSIENGVFDVVGPEFGAVIGAGSNKSEIRVGFLEDLGTKYAGVKNQGADDNGFFSGYTSYRSDWSETRRYKIVYDPNNGNTDQYVALFQDDDPTPKLILKSALNTKLPDPVKNKTSGFFFGFNREQVKSDLHLKRVFYSTSLTSYMPQLYVDQTSVDLSNHPGMPHNLSYLPWTRSKATLPEVTYQSGVVRISPSTSGHQFVYRDVADGALPDDLKLTTSQGYLLDFRCRVEGSVTNTLSNKTTGIWSGVGTLVDDGVDRILVGFATGNEIGRFVFLCGADPETGEATNMSNIQKWLSDAIRDPRKWRDYIFVHDWTVETSYRLVRSSVPTSNRQARVRLFVGDEKQVPAMDVPFLSGRFVDGTSDIVTGLSGGVPRVAWGLLGDNHLATSYWREILFSVSHGYDIYINRLLSDEERRNELVTDNRPASLSMSANIEEI